MPTSSLKNQGTGNYVAAGDNEIKTAWTSVYSTAASNNLTLSTARTQATGAGILDLGSGTNTVNLNATANWTLDINSNVKLITTKSNVSVSLTKTHGKDSNLNFSTDGSLQSITTGVGNDNVAYTGILNNNESLSMGTGTNTLQLDTTNTDFQLVKNANGTSTVTDLITGKTLTVASNVTKFEFIGPYSNNWVTLASQPTGAIWTSKPALLSASYVNGLSGAPHAAIFTEPGNGTAATYTTYVAVTNPDYWNYVNRNTNIDYKVVLPTGNKDTVSNHVIAGESIKVYDGNSQTAIATHTVTSTDISNGYYTFSLPQSQFTQGTHSLSAKLVRLTADPSLATAQKSFTVDTIAPITSNTNASTTPSGILTTDTDGPATVYVVPSATAATYAAITAAAAATATASAAGMVTLTAPSTTGSYTLYAIDAAGNVSTGDAVSVAAAQTNAPAGAPGQTGSNGGAISPQSSAYTVSNTGQRWMYYNFDSQDSADPIAELTTTAGYYRVAGTYNPTTDSPAGNPSNLYPTAGTIGFEGSMFQINGSGGAVTIKYSLYEADIWFGAATGAPSIVLAGHLADWQDDNIYVTNGTMSSTALGDLSLNYYGAITTAGGSFGFYQHATGWHAAIVDQYIENTQKYNGGYSGVNRSGAFTPAGPTTGTVMVSAADFTSGVSDGTNSYSGSALTHAILADTSVRYIYANDSAVQIPITFTDYTNGTYSAKFAVVDSFSVNAGGSITDAQFSSLLNSTNVAKIQNAVVTSTAHGFTNAALNVLDSTDNVSVTGFILDDGTNVGYTLPLKAIAADITSTPVSQGGLDAGTANVLLTSGLLSFTDSFNAAVPQTSASAVQAVLDAQSGVANKVIAFVIGLDTYVDYVGATPGTTDILIKLVGVQAAGIESGAANTANYIHIA